MSIELALISVEDIPEIVKLAKELAISEGTELTEDDVRGQKDFFEQNIDNPDMLLAKTVDTIKGIITGFSVTAFSIAPFGKHKRVAIGYALYVRPEYRGKGGRDGSSYLLYKIAEQWAIKIKKATLLVVQSTPKNRYLYDNKKGFKLKYLLFHREVLYDI